jgi:DNA-binding transcriptional MerR regulator
MTMTKTSAGTEWKVSELAALAHVTVRTLHHYHEIGLLVPSARSQAGYRLYSAEDVERLYRIQIYKELGLPLETIGRMLDGPAEHRESELRAQRDLLIQKRRRMDAVIRALDRALESIEKGSPMSTEEMTEGFDALANAPEEVRAHHAQYAREAEERWGDSYRESMQRVRGFSRADWTAIQEEGAAKLSCMADLMSAGADPEGAEAMACAEAMRQHITRWFYPCSYEVHAGLADMYVADPRFTRHYEEHAEGLASYTAAAIRANARAAEDGSR